MHALRMEGVAAGYGGTEVLHGLDLHLEAGQSLCLIGPNGAGKSTVLNAIFGFADVTRGKIFADGRDVTHLRPEAKLRNAGIAYVLQDSSVFPDLSVEHNLRLGAYLARSASEASQAVERIFKLHPLLAERRGQPARVLSGGERRLLEISRALMMNPKLLLLDEPTIGLEPRFVDMIFALLGELQRQEGKAVLLVEQNARKGLQFADAGCVLVAGERVIAGRGSELLEDPRVAALFLGD
jgi:branched-chain amino acid transport system ATP-binding protein